MLLAARVFTMERRHTDMGCWGQEGALWERTETGGTDVNSRLRGLP